MYLYRISLVCITACIFAIGCGSPSATEIYDLERRISANEKTRTDTQSSLNALAGKSDNVATQQLAQIESTDQSLGQRLGKIEASVAALKTQLESIKSDQAGTDEEIDISALAKMEDRLANLEKSLTNRVESVQPERSLTAGIDLAIHG